MDFNIINLTDEQRQELETKRAEFLKEKDRLYTEEVRLRTDLSKNRDMMHRVISVLDAIDDVLSGFRR